MKYKRKGKVGEVALKLNMHKTYDRMEWGYIKTTMQKLGFCEKRIHWMGMCMQSVRFSTQINAEGVGPMIPEKCLGQEDPLPLPFCPRLRLVFCAY